MTPCKNCAGCNLEPAAEQPPDHVEFTADGVFVKQMLIPRAGTIIPQHSHAYEHLSMLALGSVRVWKDGVFDREYTAPEGILIPANVKHTFQSLEDATIIFCIHNVARSEHVEISSEHHLVTRDEA